VRASGAPYTIVRPGWLDTGLPNDHQLMLAQDDTGTGAVSRRQVAEVLVRSLLTEEAAGRTFELFATTGNPPTDWAALFASTRADEAGDSNGIHDLPTLPLEDEPLSVRRDLDAVAAGRAPR
jgi:uncharacterized protein YbjT (DUF2867 family)